MSDTKVRRDLLLRTLLEVLDEAGEPVPAKDAISRVKDRCPYNEQEQSTTSRGGIRGDNYLYYRSAGIKAIGWIEKPLAGWLLTDKGRATLRDTSVDSLDRLFGREYRALRRAADDADAHRDWTSGLVPMRGDELVRTLGRRILTEGLGAGGSVLAPGRHAWAAETAAALHQSYNEALDFGTGKFLNKLHAQIAGASDEALLLAAEMLTLHALPLVNVSSATKTARVQTVLSWMSEPIELSVEVLEAFKQGSWNGGVGSNIQIWRALANLVDLAVTWNDADLATRTQAIDDPWAWREFLGTVPELIPSQRDALLYLAFPNTFLPIVSTEHKQRILDAFEGELDQPTGDMDRDLFAITLALQAETETRVNYYETPYVEQWWPAAAEPTQRAWLIRGSSVHGKNLVPTWLDEGWTSLWLGFLDPIEPGTPLAEVRAAIDEGYTGKSAAYRRQKAEDTFEFLNRMKPGDLVVTTSEGNLYIGEVQGEAVWSLDENLPARLRRSVAWHNASSPLAYEELPAPLPDRLTSQEDVTELTDDLAIIESLLSVDVIHTSDDVSEAATELQPLRLRPPDDELAEALLVPKAWLDKLVRVLDDRHQVILYGPPGTGKTFLASKVARFLTNNPGDARLVQFHPSYSYEDFFEGYRPVKGPEGQVAFELKAGPFRRIVEAARDNPTTPYILIIDEINRANLAKVFGELYFLLEYRDQAIDLLYAEEGTEQFRLPRNVFVIGTMNTADRSIALVDAAMRRRFGFLSLHPDEDHVKGILRGWLAKHGQSDEPARLLEALNDRIDDSDFRIGPSYLMRESVYERDDGIDEVWETSILPLLSEHHVGDGTDVERRYGLAALRKRVAPADADIVEDSEPSLPGMSATTDGDGEPDDA